MPPRTADRPTGVGAGLPWLLPFALLLPSIVWVAIDRAPWAWDEALYGQATLRYWAAWENGPRAWLRTVLGGMYFKPPGMTWAAQFFLPLARLGLTPEQAMLALNLILHGITGAVLVDLVRQRCRAGAESAVAVAFLAMGAPLAVAMAHLFFVEATQFAVVAAIYWLCLARWPASPVRQTVLLAFLAVLTLIPKLSTPVYCLWPMIVAGLVTLRSWYRVLAGGGGPFAIARRTIDLVPRGWPIDAALALATAFMAIHMLRNWPAMRAYLDYATVSEEALLFGFGHERTLLGKLGYWLESLQRATLDPALLALLGVVLGAGLLLVLRRRGARVGDGRPAALDAALAVLQVVVVLVTLAQVRNEEWRYVLPLLPPISILLGHALAAAGRTVALLAAGVLALQFCLSHAIAFGVPVAPFDRVVWIKPVTASPADRDRVRRAVELTCGRRPAGAQVLVGVEINELSDDNFAFYAAMALPQAGDRCGHGGFHTYWRRYRAGAMAEILDENDFVVTLREVWLLDRIPAWVRWANAYSLPLLEAVRQRPDFLRIDRHEDGLLVFCKPRDGAGCGIGPARETDAY